MLIDTHLGIKKRHYQLRVPKKTPYQLRVAGKRKGNEVYDIEACSANPPQHKDDPFMKETQLLDSLTLKMRMKVE